MSFSRRDFLLGSAAGALAVLAISQLPKLQLLSLGQYRYRLVVGYDKVRIVEGGLTPAMTFNGQTPGPVIFAKQGQALEIEVVNQLDEETTIHWHGLRIPVEMDGVPFLSQPPIKPGESFTYRFTPPDAGTYWYHPHMNSVEQLGRGLVGLLVVEETFAPPYHADLPLALKSWHLNDDGTFAALSQPRYAARAGTPGNVATVNAQVNPSLEIPAGGWSRLRFANVDNTVKYSLGIEGSEAWVIAIDANPLPQPILLDASSRERFAIGPGMRIDVALKASSQHTQPIKVQFYKGKWAYPLCQLQPVTSEIGYCGDYPPMPKPNPIPEPDLTQTQNLSFVFEWQGALTPVNEQGEVHYEFWTINRKAWRGGHNAFDLPEPLAKLKLHQHYRMLLKNNTPNDHPIHLHGFIFKVLNSNKKQIEPFYTDTVLLDKNEQVEIAFVADNPGNWMFHCHVIEHMHTGLMGYLQVS